eukprot:m.969746 g.969746  ORF g.969746 m.969746 type:complete len:746 (+) comp23921_c0_seq10:2533-4770(+)
MINTRGNGTQQGFIFPSALRIDDWIIAAASCFINECAAHHHAMGVAAPAGRIHVDHSMSHRAGSAPSVAGIREEARQMEEDLRSEIARLKTVVDETEANATAQCEDAETRVETEKAARRTLATQMEQLETELKSEKATNKKLAARVEEVLAENFDCANDLAEKEDECMEVREQLTLKEEAVDTLESQIKILEDRLKSLQNKSRLLGDQLLVLQAKEREDTQQGATDAALADATAKAAEAAEQCKVAEAHVAKLTADKAALSVKVESLEARLALANKDVEQGREWSTSKLKRLSSSQAIRLTEIESDYDQRIATFEMQLKLKDSELEQKENMIKKFEDEILRQQTYAKAAMKRQATIRRKDAVGTPGRDGGGDDTRRLEKINKTLKQQISQLQSKLDETEDYYKKEMAQLEAAATTVEEKLDAAQHEFAQATRKNEEKISTLERELAHRCAESNRKEKLANRLSTICDTGDTGPSSPQLQLLTKLLAESDVMEGKILRPKRGNMRKHGWETFHCKINASVMKLFREGEQEHGKSLLEIEVAHMQVCREIKEDEAIHAKPFDIPKIFHLLTVKTTKDKSVTYGERDPHVDEGNGVYRYRAHTFQKADKALLRRGQTELCSVCHKTCSNGWTTALSKNRALQCRDCKKLVHLKHVVGDEDIKKCPGKIETEEYMFMTRTKQESADWIKHINRLIKAKERNMRSSMSMSHVQRKNSTSTIGSTDSIVPGGYACADAYPALSRRWLLSCS